MDEMTINIQGFSSLAIHNISIIWIFSPHVFTVWFHYVVNIFCLVSWQFLLGKYLVFKINFYIYWKTIHLECILGSLFCIILCYVLFSVFVYQVIWIRFRDIQIQQKQKNIYNDASLSYNKSNQSGRRSPVENYEIQIVLTKTSIN